MHQMTDFQDQIPRNQRRKKEQMRKMTSLKRRKKQTKIKKKERRKKRKMRELTSLKRRKKRRPQVVPFKSKEDAVKYSGQAGSKPAIS